jgi:hypothetical protein
MADKVVSLEFNVKTAEAVTEINKVTKATEGATAATNEYEKQLNDIKKATDGAGFKELNRALKQYQDLALQAGENSPIGRQALSEAGELKDRLLDLKAAIKTTGQDGLQLQASLQLGGGIVAGFGAVQGVMALVGSESEDLQKTLVKLQAVQATLASVEEIRSVLEKESALRITAVTIAEKARAAATAVSTFVTNGASLALKVFKGALIATGIGAVVYLLFEAANAMGVFGNATEDANEKLEKQKKIREELNAQIETQLKTDLDVRKSRKNGIEDIKNEIEILKAKGASTKEIYLAEKKLINEQLANLSYAKGFRGTLTNEELIDQKKLNNEKTLLEIKYNKDIQDANDKAYEESKAKRLKQNGERTQKEYETRAEALLLLQQLDDQEKLLRDQKIADEAEALIIAMDNEAILAEEKKKQREKDLEEEIRVRDAKVQIANDLQSNLTSLGNLIINDSAKAVKFNKAMALIQIGIDTATALSKALAVTQSPSPDNVATGGLAGVAKYTGIAAMIFANAAKAKQILSSGNATGTVPTLEEQKEIEKQMQTGAPSLPGSQSTMLREQVTTVKAIVVESDITSTQKRVNSIKENATI